MKKFYLMLTVLLGAVSCQQALAQTTQDAVNFTIAINGNLASFTNTTVLSGTGDRKAHWNYGDGTKQIATPLANVSHQYMQAGTYNVCLRMFKYTNNFTDSVLTGEICKTLVIQAAADVCGAEFTDTTFTNSPLVKTYVAQTYHSNQKKPEQICWNFGDGSDTCISYNPAVNSTYNVTHAYAQSGSYNVCVKITYQGGCIKTYCRVVNVVTPTPAPVVCNADYSMEPITATPTGRKFVAVLYHSLQKKPVKICWNFGDGTDTCILYSTTFAGPYTVNHVYAAPGNYNACIKINYDAGCESTRCKVISITNVTPTPVDTCYLNVYENAANLINPVRTLYVTTPPNKVVEKICWNFGDGTDTCLVFSSSNPPQLNITHHYNAPGVYQTCAKVWYAGGCVVTKCREVKVLPTTHICGGYMTDSFTAPKVVLFKGFAVLAPNDYVTQWRWTFGDGASVLAQTASHEYLNAGTYQACLFIRSNLGCETKICRPVNILGTNNTAQLQVSPNPATTTIHAVFQSTLTQTVTVRIFNSNGIQVAQYTRNAVAGVNNWDFDISTLPTGLYTIVVQSPNQAANAVFFKQ